VELQALSLAGGINQIDIESQIVAPAQTDVVFEGQVGGEWQVISSNALGAREEIDFSTLPSLIPLRVVLEGTYNQMPSFSIGPKSKVEVGRVLSSMKHIGAAIDAGAGNLIDDI